MSPHKNNLKSHNMKKFLLKTVINYMKYYK